MKSLVAILAVLTLTLSCGQSASNDSPSTPPQSMVPDAPVDDGKGVGEITQVDLNDPLDQSLIDEGKSIYDLKCSACHKLTATRVVGPGFKGITDRRQPEWIMNMITNVDMMLEEDPTAQKLLEECLTRMPNQNVSVPDARALLEFMYDNDAAE